MLHETLLRQRTGIIAQLKLKVPHMVRRDDNLELGNVAGGVSSLHIAYGIVALGSTGRIPANPMLVLRVDVRSE